MKKKLIQKITLMSLQFSPHNSKYIALPLLDDVPHPCWLILVCEREILLMVQTGKFIPLGKLLRT